MDDYDVINKSRDVGIGGYCSDDFLLSMVLYSATSQYAPKKPEQIQTEELRCQLAEIKPPKKDNRPEWIRLNQN